MVVHVGEAARAGGHLVSDVLMDLLAGAGVDAAITLRGVEGFGARHRLRTDRLLTLSDDLPLVIVAVSSAIRIVPLAAQAGEIVPRGLVLLERAARVGGELDDDTLATRGDAKLTVYCGRGEEHRGRPVPEVVADALREAGLAGAIVLTGVDGVLHGARRRARIVSRNRAVPAMVIAVGAAERVAAALPRVRALAGRHLATVERVSILRREGVPVGPLPTVPGREAAGVQLRQRLTVTAGERDGDGARPFHVDLVRALRRARAEGATALRGAWGHTGDEARHAERLLALRRSGPVLVTLVERPAAMARLWPVVERATERHGLVTCELVPTARIVGS